MLRILKFWRWRPPFRYGLYYVATIVVFATIYWCLPGQFYHSSVRYEAPLKEDAAAITKELTAAMAESYKRLSPNSSAIAGSDWIASLNDFSLRNLSCEMRRFSFVFVLPVRRTKTTETKRGGDFSFVPTLEFSAPSSGTPLADAHESIVRSAAFKSDMFDEPEIMKLIVDLKIDRVTVHRMMAYADAMEGFPGRASGSFWRMFYLSTVTITTLGFGDIVPITTMARFLVASEAIAGTIIIGLYLWALTQHLDKNRTQ
jgi:hypothetical protein